MDFGGNRLIQAYPNVKERMGNVITTGTFDGVHRGHVEVLRTVLSEAARIGGKGVVVTFDRHPLTVIAPSRAPKLLLLPAERDRLLRRQGVSVVEMHFDAGMRGMSAGDWMRRLRGEFGADTLVLGYDNTFGRDGADLSTHDYELLGAEHGLRVISVPQLPGVSSSAVRRALAAGDIENANRMLGYPWSIGGIVEHGRGVGRRIGFRTANLAVEPDLQLPAAGVYATEVTLHDGRMMPGVTNIGMRPTFDDGGTVSVETHIPGFGEDIYGETIRIRPVMRIRGEVRFESVDDLKRRIAIDINEALTAVRAGSVPY